MNPPYPYINRSAPTTGNGAVVFAVGDIHGRADLLTQMIDFLENDLPVEAPPPLLVFLGDYIDRGPDSRGVLDLLISGRPCGYRKAFLKGNHEAAMLDFMRGAPGSRAWLEHGGLETILSYGVAPPAIGASREEVQATRKTFAEALPEAHREFLEHGLDITRQSGDYLFVHAGFDPDLDLADHSERELLWIRTKFLTGKTMLPYRVVHGHTPTLEPYMDTRRIGIDTGAYATGILSGVKLTGSKVEFFHVRSQTAERQSPELPAALTGLAKSF